MQIILPTPITTALPSSSVVIYQVQTGGTGSGTAAQEIVLIYNGAKENINVSGWCLEYSAAANGTTFSKLGCINSGFDSIELWLNAGSFASFATTSFIDANTSFTPDTLMSSGLAAAGGHLRLVDSSGQEIDRIGWGTAVLPEGTPATAQITGLVMGRLSEANLLDTDNNQSDFLSQPIINPIISGLFEQEKVVDMCSNIEEVQAVVPDGYEISSTDQTICVPFTVKLEDSVLLITELYPDAPSYDTGQEFIELYNPNTSAVLLNGYQLQLGPSYDKAFQFTSGTIGALEYLAYSDLYTGIVLPNTSAQVRLLSPSGRVVSETPLYSSPQESDAWANINGNWMFTNQVTPNLTNLAPIELSVEGGEEVASAVQPCPAGKYRNPLTNRCKTLESAITELSPCDEDEYRNPDTNRCRKVSVAGSSVSACKQGQERNPLTNRCKAMTAGDSDLVACKAGQERNPDTNRCRKVTEISGIGDNGELPLVEDVPVASVAGSFAWPAIGMGVISVLGYVVYEWRHEIRRKFVRLKQPIMQ